LQRFVLKSGEAIFIDDNHDNVISARENGFAAHHFTDAESLRRELVALDLLL
jgi:FMN phosphatase YigB (HAD superfamily)